MPEPEQPAKAIESANDGPADGRNPAPPRVTLLGLPDELLSKIFSQVHAMYMHKKRSMPPTSYLCLNKRLSMLAQPIWLSVLCAPQDKTKAERFFLGMIGMQDRLLHVRELEWTVHKAYPAYRIAIVKLLRKLQVLRLRSGITSTDYTDEAVWRAVISLDQIREVVLLSPYMTLPPYYYPPLALRRVESTPASLQQLNLEYTSLRIRLSRDEASPVLPLQKLQSLDIELEDSVDDTPNSFIASLLLQNGEESATEKCPALARLRLSSKHASCWLQLWSCLGICCWSDALARIDLRLPRTVDLEDLRFNSWPNVQRLGIIYADSPYGATRQLCDLVVGLVQLKFLELVGCDWQGDGSPNILAETPRSILDYSEAPTLYFFVQVVRMETNILELRLRSDEDIDTYEYRWTRLTSKDNFDVDCYDLA